MNGFLSHLSEPALTVLDGLRHVEDLVHVGLGRRRRDEGEDGRGGGGVDRDQRRRHRGGGHRGRIILRDGGSLCRTGSGAVASCLFGTLQFLRFDRRQLSRSPHK